MLHLNKRYSICNQNPGAGMAEVMKTNMAQTLFLKQRRKRSRQMRRLHNLAITVCEQIAIPRGKIASILFPRKRCEICSECFFKVEGLPPQPQNFASAQAVCSRKFNKQFQRMPANAVKELFKLRFIIGRRDKNVFPGTCYVVAATTGHMVLSQLDSVFVISCFSYWRWIIH